MFPLALIRPAVVRDVDDVACLLARAFADPEPVTRWLVPDPVRHAVVMPTFFEVFAREALAHGTIDLATDHDGTILGAGVWFDHTASPGAAGGPDPRLDEAFGPDASRWHALDAAMTAAHPDTPHHYLFALGVRPDLHGHGIGTRLLDAAHHRIGQQAAYLEATSRKSRRLYLRLGYTDHADPLRLPDGPALWPLWRPATPPAA